MSGTTYFNSQSLDGIKDATLSGNLYANNIIMSSNMSTNSGQGNVYFSGNLVVNGNIFSLGGSVGSGSGTSQGVTFTLPSSYSLTSAGGTQPFSSGVAGPNISGFNINLNQFAPQAVQAVTSFGATTGMLKFATGGLYQVQCVLVGDQPVAKVGIGSTTSSTFPPTASPTSNYVYVYNFPLNSSPSEVVTIPLTITDTSKWYYLDAYFSTVGGSPSLLYQTAPPSGSAAGSNYGTYVQVSPFGNYLTSATGVASGLLMNCSASTTLSAPVSSNTFRLAMTSSNGWTVNGVSTSLAVTSGGNFQINQVGIYEVSLCLNTVGATPMMFGVGSLATDTAPGTQGPYLYQYAPMYTQDPTTVVNLPLNITDTSKYYYVDIIFPGTQATVALSNVSTYVALRPVGSYVSPSTNPWSQQGTSVYYQGGAVGIGGVNPSLLTETLTINGNTSFVGNVTVTSDASSNNYVLARRVPAGSLDVTQYVTGSVPLSTTTNLIRNYLSNAATITANTSTGSITQALYVPGTTNSGVNLGSVHSVALSNLATSNLFIEAWVNFSQIGATQVICSRQTPAATDLGLYVTNTNILTFYVINASGTSFTASNATAIVAGTWYHVAGSYQATGLTTGTVRVFTNGGLGGTTASLSLAQPRRVANANVCIGNDFTGSVIFGNVADVRVMTGCVVPTATFTPVQSAPFTTAPTYVTGMSTGYTSNLTLALQSQYFPGASTSPYGPCLTLPGTVGSYYSIVNSAVNTNWQSNGFCVEAWVNFASFANAGYTIGVYGPTSGGFSWSLSPSTTGTLIFSYYNSSTFPAVTSTATITTGSWNHIVAQSNGTNIWLFINGVVYLAAGTAISGTAFVSPSQPLVIGQQNSQAPANFAIAKARLVFGNDTSAGSKAAANVYSSGNFTANPNFAAVPAGATVAWSLESQYPLPTYPSFFDVPQLPQQIAAYGAEPVVVGGVTSNVVGPFGSSYPQLDSIRFDGTGYIDYGNAASSVLTANLWASPWTIEGWVYPTVGTGGNQNLYSRYPDFFIWLSTGASVNQLVFQIPGGTFLASTAVVNTNSWNHIAVTYDGSKSNIYINGSYNTNATPSALNYTPTISTQIGYSATSGAVYFNGNLADLRVSNVARYTGSSYTVPTAPFSTDSSTLLLLKSLGGQVGTTLEVQGRGLNSTSIGATQTIRAYPPAPMSSYLLDTTSNASVTYGQGKYVASASSEYAGGAYPTWNAFDKTTSWSGTPTVYPFWSTIAIYANGGGYLGSNVTVDVIGSSYVGEWLQLQMPVSVVLSNYIMAVRSDYVHQSPVKFWVLGSRDGINWTLVDSRSGVSWASTTQTFTVGATQAYTYYRFVTNTTTNATGNNPVSILELILNGTEESLCVTSDAKVGVGIANPQRALEVAGDLVVSGTISGGAGLGSFRNRIINGDMRIAQRGTSAVIGSSASTTYNTLDRWGSDFLFTTGSVTQTQQTLTASDTPYQLGLQYSQRYTVTSGITAFSYYAALQRIEAVNVADLNWGTPFGQPVTVSFWFRTNIPTGSGVNVNMRSSAFAANFNQNFTVLGGGQWQYVTVTIPPPPNGTSWATYTTLYVGGLQPSSFTATPGWAAAGNYLGLNGTYPWPQNAGNYIEFTGVQLERGTVATPFEVRPFAQELALCQRYFYQVGDGITGSGNGGIGPAFSTTQASIMINVPVPMRVYPTSFSATGLNLYNASTNIAITALAANGEGTAQVPAYYATVASGLTIATYYKVIGSNTNSRLQLNAEL